MLKDFNWIYKDVKTGESNSFTYSKAVHENLLSILGDYTLEIIGFYNLMFKNSPTHSQEDHVNYLLSQFDDALLIYEKYLHSTNTDEKQFFSIIITKICFWVKEIQDDLEKENLFPSPDKSVKDHVEQIRKNFDQLLIQTNNQDENLTALWDLFQFITKSKTDN